MIYKLSVIHLQTFSLEEFESQLKQIKEGYISQGNEDEAKQLWVYQKIVEIHSLYRNAYNLLKHKEYFKGWCQLERIEIVFESIKRHLDFDKTQYSLWHIEKSVKNLQVLFPYRLFGSSELLKKKKKCSVCDKEISIRKPCGHIVGEIYQGEMCYRIATEVEVLGMALVENPGNKFSVMFPTDESTGEQIDHYNYVAIDYLFALIGSPYEKWELEVSEKEITTEDFNNIGRNDPCTCRSGKKFKYCCRKKIGDKYAHFEFISASPVTSDVKKNISPI